MNKKICPKSKRAQEEMVGFALIIIIVAVILLIFLSFSLKNSKEDSIGTHETSSFVQALLAYTTDCREDQDTYYSIQDLIKECVNYDSACLDERKTCDVLNSTIKSILEESWPVGENRPVKGYEFGITDEEAELIYISEGNRTKNYKFGFQEFSSRGNTIQIGFTAYY